MYTFVAFFFFFFFFFFFCRCVVNNAVGFAETFSSFFFFFFLRACGNFNFLTVLDLLLNRKNGPSVLVISNPATESKTAPFELHYFTVNVEVNVLIELYIYSHKVCHSAHNAFSLSILLTTHFRSSFCSLCIFAFHSVHYAFSLFILLTTHFRFPFCSLRIFALHSAHYAFRFPFCSQRIFALHSAHYTFSLSILLTTHFRSPFCSLRIFALHSAHYAFSLSILPTTHFRSAKFTTFLTNKKISTKSYKPFYGLSRLNSCFMQL